MNGLHTRGGRYIPAGTYATDADRLRAVEGFLAKYTQEIEYVLERLENAVAELEAAQEQNDSEEVVV